MALYPYVSLFTGGAGLDLAIRIAVPNARCVRCVEIEAPATATLAARMEEETLDPSPIWSDIRSFDGRSLRGKVDGIVGGFPCQDLSVAGKRAGIRRGNRSGLFFEYVRIIREVRPKWVFIENVPPILHLRAGRTVFRELAKLGLDAEWLSLRASDVGAPHQRKRVFILAYRAGNGDSLADSEHTVRRTERKEHRNPHGRNGSGRCCADVGHANLPRPQGRSLRDGGCGDKRIAGASGAAELADIEGHQRQRSGRASGGSLPLFPPGPSDTAAWQRILSEHPHLAPAVSKFDLFVYLLRRAGLLPVGVERTPEGIGRALRQAIHAPEAQSAFRRVAHELADWLDERTDSLRSGGNGVVALQGALAFITLARRAGLQF